MYRASTNPPKTAWARHLDQVMRDRKWSRVNLFEAVGAELGYAPKSRSAMLPLLIDKEPNEAQATVLRKHFGEPPAEVAPAPTGATESDDPLIRALSAQTRALTDLAAQVKALVESQKTPEGMAHATGEVVALAVREALQAVGLVAGPPES